MSMISSLLGEVSASSEDFITKEFEFTRVSHIGSAGSVMASRLSEISEWKVLLLEAGGHETEISDVPLLSLYLHKSKMDWKYR